MPRKRFDCGTCGVRDLPRHTYYEEHHNNACLAAAVAAVRKRRAPAAQDPPAGEGAWEAPEQDAGEFGDGELPYQAADEPAAGNAPVPEPTSSAEDREAAHDHAAAEPHMERLFEDADRLLAISQHNPLAEDPNANPAARDQSQEAAEAAAPHDPELQELECPQHRHLTEEAGRPIEADEPDAEHEYAAPEDQQFLGERPGDAEADQSAAKPGTAAYYHLHRHDRLYAGAQLTVEQMCYLMLSQKQTHRQHDTAFDEQCRLQRDVLLPRPNMMPGSLYLMRKVRFIAMSAVSELAQHACARAELPFAFWYWAWLEACRALRGHGQPRNEGLPDCHAHNLACASLPDCHTMLHTQAQGRCGDVTDCRGCSCRL